jgi:hypothetical protein
LLLSANGLGFAENAAHHRSPDVAKGNDISILAQTERSAPSKKADGCEEAEIEPNAAPPNWDSPAMTTQCGVLELDTLLTVQQMSGAIRQGTMGTTARLGVKPRLEIRWGMPGRSMQSGDGAPMVGTTDQLVGVCYRFHNRKGGIPDLALDYAIKIPTANPAKGFGSGYTDHAGTLIAGGDVGSIHFDFNALGTVTGNSHGHDGAVQFGLAIVRHLSSKFLGTLEAFGGSQPGTSNRYGAASAGGAWSFRPWLAVNGAYVRAYTGASPRQQFLVGMIYTMRPAFAAPERKPAEENSMR